MSTPSPSPAISVPSDEMLAHHLDLMFEHTRAAFLGVIVVSTISVIALWTLADQRLLLAWIGLLYLLTLGRILYVRRYRRLQPPPSQARRWAWGFAFTTLLSGLIWGSLGVLFYDPANPLTVIFVAWVLAGVITAAVPSLSSFPPAYILYVLPATVPYAYSSFVAGGIYTWFGVMTAYFLIANVMYARSAHRATDNSIRLRFENRALLEQLQAAKEHAESANSAKTKFLAAASHDLRQPTHALGLFMGALERMLSRTDALKREALLATVTRMRRTLKSMGMLLSALLDASRLEAGTVQVQRGTVRLQDQFENLQSEFIDAAQAKGIGLRFVRTGTVVNTDPVLLRRILSNLLANAIKYTERGHVVVGCRRRGNDIEIQVHDTGIGIEPAHYQKIFEEYVQLGNAANNREQGLGLGLAIVRRMAEMLGHEVGVRSHVRRGSVFSIRLPRRHAPSTYERIIANVVPTAATQGAIIVIDDDTATREAIVEILEVHEYEVIAASSIDDIRARLSANKVNALMIIADYRLGGGVTGIDAIAAVQPLLERPAPAIIVTGDTSPERIREGQASGYPLLHKPLDPEKLLDVLRQATQERVRVSA